jgi:hypothetical protein
MSLSRKIAAEVDDLVKTCAPPLCITAEEGPHKIDLPVGLATSIGIECAGFDFHVADRAGLSLDDLRRWGDRVVKKVTYLMEPLAVHEADAPGHEVVLRSATPTAKPDRRSYYEVRLKGSGDLKFERIAFDEEKRQRGSVPCLFTNEVVERLVEDLVATAP